MITTDNLYQNLLMQYNHFDTGSFVKENLPDFTYMEKNSEPLVELRDRLGIPERIKGLSETETILTLLKLVYETIPYDGSAPNPPIHDAITLMLNPQPVNCWIKASVLNEIYLSTGFKSRILFCLPADPDGDNHVVTLVYSISLEKWISVDSCHNTYFISGDGHFSNAIEARHIYAEGSTPHFKHIERETTAPLFCGGISCDSYDEFYQVYMAKDCFRFICPVKSEYRYDRNPDAVDYILLNPTDYDIKRGSDYDDRFACPSKRYYTHSVRFFLEDF